MIRPAFNDGLGLYDSYLAGTHGRKQPLLGYVSGVDVVRAERIEAGAAMVISFFDLIDEVGVQLSIVIHRMGKSTPRAVLKVFEFQSQQFSAKNWAYKEAQFAGFVVKK